MVEEVERRPSNTTHCTQITRTLEKYDEEKGLKEKKWTYLDDS